MLTVLRLLSISIWMAMVLALIGARRRKISVREVRLPLNDPRDAEWRIRLQMRRLHPRDSLCLCIEDNGQAQAVLMIAQCMQRKNPALLIFYQPGSFSVS